MTKLTNGLRNGASKTEVDRTDWLAALFSLVNEGKWSRIIAMVSGYGNLIVGEPVKFIP